MATGRRDINIEAEQAVLGSLLADPACFDLVADILRPDVFGVPEHRAVATEIVDLIGAGTPPDPVLVSQRLKARKVELPPEFVFDLARSIGVTANVRHYVETLESTWAGREARRVARDLLNLDADLSGEELVARFAQQLSAIETRKSRPARKLAELMFERLERRDDLHRHPEKLKAALWPTGFRALDVMVGGLRAGHLFTIAARPGVGKSAFVSAMTDSLAERGVPVGVFQLEDYGDAFADRTISRRGHIPTVLMRDGARWETWHWDAAVKVVHERADWPIYIDDQHGRTIGDITGAMRRMARELGVKVFVLDNLAEVVIDGQDRGEERLDRALGRIAKTFRDAANAVGAAPVLLVHLNRDLEKAGGRPPRLSDIKNSGELEDASHVVALFSRAKDSDVFSIDVAKNRNGPRGEVELQWVGETMTVQDRRVA